MDKKNTMLLTVIAVATLLVAVVGATFAYFSVTATNQTTSTTLNTTVEDVGTVVLDQGIAALYVDLTVEDMSNAVSQTENNTFYAVDALASKYSLSKVDHTIATASVTGGSDSANYDCGYTLTVTGNNLPSGLVAADGQLVLSGATGLNKTITLAELQTAGATGITVPVDFHLTGAGAEQDIVAYAYIKNTTDEQNYLDALNATITISSNEFACDTVESFN